MKTQHSLKATLLALTLMVAAPTATTPLFAQTALPQQQQEEKEKRGGILGKVFGQDAKKK